MLLHPFPLLVLFFSLVSLFSPSLVSLSFVGLITFHVSILTVYSGLMLKLNLKNMAIQKENVICNVVSMFFLPSFCPLFVFLFFPHFLPFYLYNSAAL